MGDVVNNATASKDVASKKKSQIKGVNKQLVVTKGFYRGKRSYCSYCVDLGDYGVLYYLDEISAQGSAPYFHESWVSDKY